MTVQSTKYRKILEREITDKTVPIPQRNINKDQKSIKQIICTIADVHTICHFKHIHLKLDTHTQGKWPIHGPKHRKENQLLTLLLIIISLVYKSDINEDHYNLSNPLFGKNFRGQKHPKEMNKCWNSIASNNLSKINFNWLFNNQCPQRAGHHRPSLPPSTKHLNTNYYPISLISEYYYL